MKFMRVFKSVVLSCLLLILLISFSACRSAGTTILDPENPVTITIWHHYTGIVLNAFESAITEFNETVGREQGIIAEGVSIGWGDLEVAVRAAARQEVGGSDLPNIFTSLPDVAYVAMELGLLVDLDEYFTLQQQEKYFAPFIERGRIGYDGELHIFPVVMSGEVLMINHTDWLPFAQANNLHYDDLSTREGVTRVAQLYYQWSGGNAFFGHDAMGNLFVTGMKQFGVEIFEVNRGQVTVNIDEYVMRRIWDNYYVPFVSGYFAAQGRFRSDDLRVGDILAYVGSTVSAAFFPEDVRIDGESRAIEAKVLPVPLFEGGSPVIVRQGPGMVVTKSSEEQQYASLIFLRWFTEPQQNVSFSALSGHVPIILEGMSHDLIRETAIRENIELTTVTDDALRVALNCVQDNEMYSSQVFANAVATRPILDLHLRRRAQEDREAVLELIASGVSREDAIAQFVTEESFKDWLEDFTAELMAAAHG